VAQNKHTGGFYSKNTTPMTLKPLDMLKKGLYKITQSFEVRKYELDAKLARKESIFGHEGNTVD
jgi:hypothetical protein